MSVAPATPTLREPPNKGGGAVWVADGQPRGRDSLARFQAESLLRLGSGQVALQPSASVDFLHGLRVSFVLLPSMVLTVGAIYGAFEARRALNGQSAHFSQFGCIIASVICFSISLATDLVGFRLHPLIVTAAVAVYVVLPVSVLPLAISQALPLVMQMVVHSGIFGVACTFQCVLVLSRSEMSWSCLLIFSGILGFNSAVAVTFILEYSLALLSTSDLATEILLSGIVFPFFVALAGKTLIVDFVSFGFVRYLKTGSFRSAAFHWILFVKQVFHASTQMTLINLDTLQAFCTVVALSMVAELAGLVINIRLLRSKFFERFQSSAGASTSASKKSFKRLLNDWAAVRLNNTDEKLVLYVMGEEIAEKINTIAAIFVAMWWPTLHGAVVNYRDLGIRAAILLLVDLGEDFLKKRLLWRLSRLALSHMEPKLPSPKITLSLVLNCTSALFLIFASELTVAAKDSQPP